MLFDGLHRILSFSVRILRSFFEKYSEKLLEILEKVLSRIFSSYLKAKEETDRRYQYLSNREYDLSWQYNDILVGNYVNRRFHYFDSKDFSEFNIRHLKRIINNKNGTNVVYRLYDGKKKHRQDKIGVIVIIGKAGSGKTTALKYLFINTNITDSNYLFFYSRQFSIEKYPSVGDVLDFIKGELKKKDGLCTVFFDGLDELPCIKGDSEEFAQMFDFFNKMSNSESGNNRFIISTRSEHFNISSIKQNGSIKSINGVSITPDNWLIVETSDINSRETYRICKSIKHLYKYDVELGGGRYRSHFYDKWPEHKRSKEGVGEYAYLRLLKQFIKNSIAGQSLLSSPLLCRYAYPIICEWNNNTTILENNYIAAESQRICNMLSFYIKWEFHDHFSGSTKAETGKQQLDIYMSQVYEFLTIIAGKMGLSLSISKDSWSDLREKYGLVLNAAFCVLQEEDGQLFFIHSFFQEYFRVLYFLEKGRRIAKKDTDVLNTLLETDSLFSTMYAEQLCINGSKSVKQICSFLLQKIGEDDEKKYEKLADYISGKSILFVEDPTFTVQEYLTAFHKGKVFYCGIRFDLQKFEELKSTGILELNSIYVFENLNPEILGKDVVLKGIIISEIFNDESPLYPNIGVMFRCIVKGDLVSSTLIFKSKQDIKKSAAEQYVSRVLSKEEIGQEINELSGNLNLIRQKIADPNNVWILYYNNTYYVLNICKSTGPLFSNYFKSVMEIGYRKDLVTLYADYCANVKKYALKCYSIDKLPISFMERDSCLEELSPDQETYRKRVIITVYNSIWWSEYALLYDIKGKSLEDSDLNNLVFCKSMDAVADIVNKYTEILMMYQKVTEIYANVIANLLSLKFTEEVNEYLLKIGACICELQDERLVIALSDLVVILYFLLKFRKGNDYINRFTEPLCLKNDYRDGIKFRNDLLSADYTLSTIDWIDTYLSAHFWVNIDE